MYIHKANWIRSEKDRREQTTNQKEIERLRRVTKLSSRWMKWFHHVWSQQQEKDDSKTIMSRIAQEIWSETKEAERVPFSYLVIIRLHSIYHLESSLPPTNSDFKLPTIPKLRYLWFYSIYSNVTSHRLIPRRTFACCDKLYYRDTLSKHIGAPASIGEWRMNWICYLCWVTIAYGYILKQ